MMSSKGIILLAAPAQMVVGGDMKRLDRENMGAAVGIHVSA